MDFLFSGCKLSFANNVAGVRQLVVDADPGEIEFHTHLNLPKQLSDILKEKHALSCGGRRLPGETGEIGE